MIRVVLDHLNTHKIASLYEAFEPAEAHHGLPGSSSSITPLKHGSWLNMAEIELSILQQQCLDCRIPDATRSRVKLRPGNTSAMESRPPSTGVFCLRCAQNSNDSIPHFQRDEVLGRVCKLGSGLYIFGMNRHDLLNTQWERWQSCFLLKNLTLAAPPLTTTHPQRHPVDPPYRCPLA